MKAGDLIESYLRSQAIPFERGDHSSWALQLRGERKHAIPVVLTVRERSIEMRSFFIRRPIDDPAEFYRMLLARNLRASTVRFAADVDGDVYLAAEIPAGSFDEASLDALLGEVLYTADQMFDAAIGAGFSSYRERERAWRAQQAGKEISEAPDESPTD